MDSKKSAKIPKFRKNFEKILSTSTLNILFVLDSTGSMNRHRDMVSESISLLCSKLSSINNIFKDRSATVKLGVLAYRDKKDTIQFETLDFTNDEQKVSLFLKKLECEGGGDACEDIKGAFQQVLSVNKFHWDAQYKFLVLISDVPCHGKLYHDFTDKSYDDFPEENMDEEVKQLALNDIHFIGITFTSTTQKMYKEIEKIYKGNHGNFRLIDNDDLKNIKKHEKCTQNILNLFVQQISDPIEELTKSTVNEFLKKKKISSSLSLSGFIAENSRINFEIIAEDDDNFYGEETYEAFNFTCDPKTIDYSNIESFDICSEKINEWQCQIATTPIGKGTFRSIFLLKVLQDDTKKNKKTPYNLYIAKAPIKAVYYKNPEEIKSEWRGSLIAANFAKKFNSELYGVGNKGDLLVYFNDVFILKSKKTFLVDGKQQSKYYAVEKVLKGTFTKYNNNFDFVADFSKYEEKTKEMSAFNKVAQAFSHYTFQKSDGNLLVCDLQGVVNKLTDPMILTKNKSNLSGDLSCAGIAQFFATHQCNDICKILDLESMKPMITDDIKKQILEIKEKMMSKKINTLSTGSSDDEDNDDMKKEKEEKKKAEKKIPAFRFELTKK